MSFTATAALQFRGYNSLHIQGTGAKVLSDPFVVTDMTHISISFWSIANSAVPSANRFRLREYGAAGAFIQERTFAFAPGHGQFEQHKFEGLELHAGATTAAVEFFTSSSESYYIAAPKAEEGVLSTAYSPNLTNFLTRLTSYGLYTGTITAEQVLLVGSKETAHQRFATINSNMLQFSSSISGNQRDIASLSAQSLTLETRLNANDQRLTKIAAGEITLSASTSGRLAGMALSSDALTVSSTGAYLHISTNPSDGYFIYAGSSAAGADRKFLLDRQGRITAKDVTLTGNITATSGKIGGFTIDGNRLSSSNNSRTMRISGLGSDDFLYMYNPGNGALFRVDSNGAVTANLVTITGAVTANSNSTIGGRLNSVTGTLNGVGGSVYGLGGSVSGLGGYVSGLGGSIGSSGSYMGGYYGGGTYGTISSASGYLGGVQYYSSSGRLVFGGAITPSGIVTAYSGINCGSAQGTFGTVLYSTLTKKSDERFKQKITRPIQDFAQMIYGLPIKDYEYISAPNKRQLGVIAQEINQTQERWVSQRLVGHDNDGYLNIDYENLYMAGLLAIQDLNQRVKQLEEAI